MAFPIPLSDRLAVYCLPRLRMVDNEGDVFPSGGEDSLVTPLPFAQVKTPRLAWLELHFSPGYEFIQFFEESGDAWGCPQQASDVIHIASQRRKSATCRQPGAT